MVHSVLPLSKGVHGKGAVQITTTSPRTIITFGAQAAEWPGGVRPAGPGARALAREYVSTLSAAGATPNQRLIIVPHLRLHYLPFAAFRDPRTQRYLIEDYTITYAPSASSIRFLREKETPGAQRVSRRAVQEEGAVTRVGRRSASGAIAATEMPMRTVTRFLLLQTPALEPPDCCKCVPIE